MGLIPDLVIAGLLTPIDAQPSVGANASFGYMKGIREPTPVRSRPPAAVIHQFQFFEKIIHCLSPRAHARGL